METVCGSCDFKTVQPTDKLSSHYMTEHTLSHADARIMVLGQTGRMLEGQTFFDRFYQLVKLTKLNIKHEGSGRAIHITNHGYLEIAKKAAGIR